MYEKIEIGVGTIIFFQTVVLLIICLFYRAQVRHYIYLGYLAADLIKTIFTHINVFNEDLYKQYFDSWDQVLSISIVVLYASFLAVVLDFEKYFPKFFNLAKKLRLKWWLIAAGIVYALDAFYFPEHNRSWITLVLLIISGIFLALFFFRSKKLELSQSLIFFGSVFLLTCAIATVIMVALDNNSNVAMNAYYYLFLPGLLVETICFSAALLTESYSALLKIKDAEKLAVDAELKALRAQLNPHFVQNTFNLLARKALSGDPEETVDTMRTVSGYVRKVLYSSENNLVSLEQEIDYTTEYLDVQKLLNHGLFNYTINIDDSVDTIGITVPSMMLQPIVENCIKHGFENMESDGLIEINITNHEDEVLIKILDNGKGVNIAAENALQKGLEITKRRLWMSNRDGHAGVSLQNRVDCKGSIVTIKYQYR